MNKLNKATGAFSTSPTEDLHSFVQELTSILGSDRVIVSADTLAALAVNSLGVTRMPSCLIKAQSTEEVQAIVQASQKHGMALYPFSRGKNIGYGEKTPSQEGLALLDLSLMNQILQYDATFAEIEIQPGVTQAQLYEYLKHNGNKHIADMTGAALDASVVGNILESGFGHTPLGNHRKNILDIEVVLGTGEILRTGEFPNLGPNLSGLFVQSNFGVITSVRIPLLLMPEMVVTYTLQFATTEDMARGVEAIRALKQRGVLQGLIHIGNATRTFMSLNTFPDHLPAEKILSDDDCQALMSNPLLRAGRWTAVGAFYGSPRQIEVERKILKATLKDVCAIRFFSDTSFARLTKLVQFALMPWKKVRAQIVGSLQSLEALHGLTKGIPTQRPSENIFWRVKTKTLGRLGLIWFCPVIKADRDSIQSLITMARPIYAKYRFEMPITLTLIDHKHLIAVFNLNFDRAQKEEISRAHKAHEELVEAARLLGITPYRSGLLDNPRDFINADRWHQIEQLKKTFDPHNVISPNRYGIAKAT